MVTRGGAYGDWILTFFGPCFPLTEDIFYQLLAHLDLHTVTEVLALEYTSPMQFVTRIPGSLAEYARHFAAIYAYTRHSLRQGPGVETFFFDFLTNTTRTFAHVYNALRTRATTTPPEFSRQNNALRTTATTTPPEFSRQNFLSTRNKLMPIFEHRPTQDSLPSPDTSTRLTPARANLIARTNDTTEDSPRKILDHDVPDSEAERVTYDFFLAFNRTTDSGEALYNGFDIIPIDVEADFPDAGEALFDVFDLMSPMPWKTIVHRGCTPETRPPKRSVIKWTTYPTLKELPNRPRIPYTS